MIAIASFVAACGGSDSAPASPTSPSASTPATTRIIALSGNLAFGDVPVGSERDASLTISNRGNATLTITGMSIPGGMADQLSASWTSGQIPAGGSQAVTIRFSPTSAGSYNGSLSVNGDQTSGVNTLAISASSSGMDVSGRWSGAYVVERCNGTGSVQDLLCSQNRGLFPPGSSLPVTIDLRQNGANVTGTLAFGQVTGPVTGVVGSSGTLTLQGTARSSALAATITSWSVRVEGSQMTGSIGYDVTLTGVPGVGSVGARLGRVTR